MQICSATQKIIGMDTASMLPVALYQSLYSAEYYLHMTDSINRISRWGDSQIENSTVRRSVIHNLNYSGTMI